MRLNPRSAQPWTSLALGLASMLTVLASRASAQGASAPPGSVVAADTRAPQAISELAVAYPEGASGEATVVLTLTIERDGTVSAAVPNQANEPFSSVAIAAAMHWQFQPALRRGVPVRARIRVEVGFHPPESHEAEPPEEPAGSTTKDDSRSRARAPAAKPAAKPIEIQVLGVKPDPSRTATLSRAEVRQIPGTFGDPFRALEIMPGVTPIISGLPFFFVRGAPPGDVGYFLDGIRVPLLFHIGVGPSVVHPALIDRVDLYPGGYPARFGRFSGGIVSGETVPESSDLHGEYNVRLFDAGALIEAPFDEHRGDVLLAGRYSYTAALLSLLQSSTELNYWDYQARIGYRVTPKDELSVFSFGSYDYLGERTPTGTLTLFGTEFHRIDARYDHDLGQDGTLRFATTVGLDRSRLPDDRFVRDRMIGSRAEAKLRLGPGALLRFGSDVTLDSFDVQLNSAEFGPAAAEAAANLFPTRVDVVAGTRVDLVLSLGKRLQLTPGVRFDYYTSQGQAALGIDPRLSSRLEVTRRLAFLSTFGIAHQAPAFVVPLPGFQPGGLRGGLQTALQQSAGLEYDFGDATTATATVFHNGFLHMSDPLGSTPMDVNGCIPGTFPEDTLGGDRGGASTSGRSGSCGTSRFPSGTGTVGPDRSGGGGQGADSTNSVRASNALEARTDGAAYGLELFLKRRLTSRVGGFLSYTLSRSIRTLDNRQFVATFDRTHVLNAALAYNLGRNWRAGTRLTFYTGLPKAPDPTDPGATRLPPFFKLDLRLEKRWQLGPKAYFSFIAEWMNATLSKEAVSTTCTLQGCETRTIGPITIPSLGIEGGF